MPYLLTGANNGFLGTAIKKRLDTVIHVDHEVLLNGAVVEKIIADNKIDAIIHCAGVSHHLDEVKNEDLFIGNTLKTFNLLEACRTYPIKAFINISTSSVYGQKVGPMKENDLPQTNTMYGASKLATESYARAYAYIYDLPIVNVRPASIYGPGEADYRFMPTIAHALIHDIPLSFTPSPMHTWVYIDDFVDAILFIVKHAKELQGETINIGTGVQNTNKEVLEIFEMVSGKKVELTPYNTKKPNDNWDWCVSGDRLKNMGFQFQTSLIDGITQTYRYYESRS